MVLAFVGAKVLFSTPEVVILISDIVLVGCIFMDDVVTDSSTNVRGFMVLAVVKFVVFTPILVLVSGIVVVSG